MTEKLKLPLLTQRDFSTEPDEIEGRHNAKCNIEIVKELCQISLSPNSYISPLTPTHLELVERHQVLTLVIPPRSVPGYHVITIIKCLSITPDDLRYQLVDQFTPLRSLRYFLLMPNPDATLCTSHSPWFTTARTDPHDNVSISAWEALLYDRSELRSSDTAAAGNGKAPGEVDPRPIKIRGNKND